MSPPRTIALVVAVAVALTAAFVVLGRRGGAREDDPGAVEGVLPGSAPDPSPAGGRAGVSARAVDQAGRYVVSGHVVDEDGQALGYGTLVLQCLTPAGEVEPIEGGVVPLSSDGEFEGPGCAHEVCAELRHPVAVPAEPWSLRPAQPAELRARLLARFEGEVVDGDGQPVPGATVTLTRTGDETEDPTAVLPFMTRSTTTDAEGRFSVAWIERPPCDACQEVRQGCEVDELRSVDAFEVAVRATGWGPAHVRLTLEQARLHGADAPVRIALAASADILSGRLVDPLGRPYPRAFVLARSSERPSEQRRSEVVGDTFEVDGLGEGGYDVRAIQDGVELARLGGVEAGEDVLLTGQVRADGPELRVTVLDEGGRAVRARVDGGPFRDAFTDAQGRAKADSALPGAVTLRVRAAGFEPQLRAVEIPSPADEDAPPVEVRVELRALARGPARP